MTLLADLCDIDPDDLSDSDAVRIASAIRLEQDAAWWEGVCSGFRIPDDSEWPFDYDPVYAWRERVEAIAGEHPDRWPGIKEFYRTRLDLLICHWCNTYDPRNAGTDLPVRMPLLLFKRQREFVRFMAICIRCQEGGLAEKCRDMGVTWVAGAFSVGVWATWPGAAVGWGSRKEQLVDRLGDPDSIFEKLRMIIDGFPEFLRPRGFSRIDDMTYMKIINRETGATITGEAGDNIGRGGRKLFYCKDEAGHLERPERIEAALADNTRVQFDISTPNGLGNVFHRRREAGKDWAGEEVLQKGRTSVFVFDWRDHPAKTQAWYDQRKQKAIDDGLPHIFAQEVDRDYAASVEGVIIPLEWIRSAIDAHLTLAHLDWRQDSAPWHAALDVADGLTDGAGDTNALSLRRGSVLRSVEDWSERDTGATTRRAARACEDKGFIDIDYDCIGVGSGVKAEVNRLNDDGQMPGNVRFVPWNAAAGPLDPDRPIVPDDMDSPLNGDFFLNLKAQGWWFLRLRFERTHRAVTEGIEYHPDLMISLPSDLPQIRQVEKELAQPTIKKLHGSMKLVVDKTPDGTRSPNKGDSIMMNYHPVPGLRPVFSIATSQFAVPYFDLPPHWPRGFAMKADGERVCALWAAFDRDMDVLYITAEHSRRHAEPVANAAAILGRGNWIPGVIHPPLTRSLDELRAHLATWITLGLTRLDLGDRAVEPGITDMHDRLSTGRLRFFAHCTEAITEYQAYRRAEDGTVMGEGLMCCARLLCRPATIARMIAKPPDPMLARSGAGMVDDYTAYP